ncbi:MAG: hypothetical protein N3F07_01235 [Candidatus Micrarchaeota archaeon]|nr:hypothetical protein [Candidatus Micrarchaeota archaeon]
MLFGCTITVKTEQKIAKDGTAKIIQTIDMKDLVELSKTARETYLSINTAPEPDLTYSAEYYSKMASPESESVSVVIDSKSLANLSPGESVTLDVHVTNNANEKMRNVLVEAKSKAIVPYEFESKMQDYLYNEIAKRQTETAMLTGQVANVTPGRYPITVTVAFDRGGKENIVVAKTVEFEVKEKESLEANYSYEIERQYSEICLKLIQQDPSLKCSFNDGVIALEKTISPNDNYRFKAEENFFDRTYNVTITSMPTIVSQETMDEYGSGGMAQEYGSGGMAQIAPKQKFKDGINANIAMMSSFLKATYVVHMPAKIESAPGGKISDDGMSVSYDVWELYSKKQDIQIFSREQNESNRIIFYAGAAVLALAVIAGAAFLLRPKSPQAPPAQIQ